MRPKQEMGLHEAKSGRSRNGGKVVWRRSREVLVPLEYCLAEKW